MYTSFDWLGAGCGRNTYQTSTEIVERHNLRPTQHNSTHTKTSEKRNGYEIRFSYNTVFLNFLAIFYFRWVYWPWIMAFAGFNTMRVDDGRKGCSLLAIKKKARTVVGRGEKGLLGDPGSALGLGRETEKENVRRKWKG